MNSPQPVLTDVGEFLSELDAGVFERKLAVALSQVAAAATVNDRVGEVNLSFVIKKVPGTNQVTVQHKLKYVKPTTDGKATEEEKRATVFHVGKHGRLSLAPESQLSMFSKPPAQPA